LAEESMYSRQLAIDFATHLPAYEMVLLMQLRQKVPSF